MVIPRALIRAERLGLLTPRRGPSESEGRPADEPFEQCLTRTKTPSCYFSP